MRAAATLGGPARSGLRPGSVGVGGACAVLAGLLGAAAGRSPLVVAVLAGVLLLGVAVVANPDVATLAVVFVLYSNVAVVAVRLHGLPAFAGASVPLLLVVPLAYLLVSRQPLVVPPAFPYLCAYLAVQVVGTVLAEDRTRAMANLSVFLVEGLGLYFLVVNVVRTRAVLRRAVWTMVAVGALLGALSVFQQYTKTYDNDYLGFAQISRGLVRTGGTETNVEHQPRLEGPIGETNRYAQVLVVLVPLGLFCYRNEREASLRLLAAAATVMIAFGVVLTFSRGAALGLVAALAVMTFLGQVRPRQVLSVVAGLVVLLLAVPGYRERLATVGNVGGATAQEGTEGETDNAIRGRATENLAALRVFLDYPVLGVGPGLFPSYYPRYGEEVGIRAVNDEREAHNLYLSVAAETGVLGLFAFGGMIVVTLRDLAAARRRWRHARPEVANLATGFFLAVVTYLTTGFFLHLSYARYFWLLMALAAAAGTVARQPEATGPLALAGAGSRAMRP